MKKDKKNKEKNNKATDKKFENDMPIKNTTTDSVKNTASQIPGLNQDKTTRDDLRPSDGDNLTN